MIGTLSRVFITVATRKMFLGTVSGTENIPSSGGYILVANHSSFMDHFIIATVLKQYRKSRVYYLTKKESFMHPLSRMWHLSVGCIPLNRNSADTAAFRAVLKYLSEGKAVCIYPEGTRSFTGKIMDGKPGAVKMALISKVPIVPVGLNGTFDILPKHRLIPRRFRASVEIGVPILPESFEGNGPQRIQQATKQIMDDLERLSHQMRDTTSVNPSAPTIDEQIAAAKEWNEMGIHPSEMTKFHPEILHRRAKYICEGILRNESTNADAYFELGRAIGRIALASHSFKKVRLIKKSKRMFDKALALDVNHAHTHYALGMWHLQVPHFLGGDKALALKHYQRAVECDPNEVFLYMGLAQCQIKMGLRHEAQRTLEHVLMVQPKSNHDVRRKVEALAQLLRWNPEYRLESGLMEACFKNLATG